MSESSLMIKSKEFALEVIRACRVLREANCESALINQFLLSGTSIGANVREAFYAHGKADFAAKLHIALKECSETEYWLELLIESGYYNDKTILDRCVEVKRILIASINTAKGNSNMSKPVYVYHGSQYFFDVVRPQQARSANATESQNAIYAAETIDEVIPFALPIRWYPDDPTGKRAFSCKNGKTFIEYGSLDPNGVGYIYKLRADNFEKLDEWQWISKNEVIPDEVICIHVKDYLHTVTFSEKAKEIQKILFG